MTGQRLLKATMFAILILALPAFTTAAEKTNVIMEEQQQGKVTGVISNSEGPLVGAAIIIKGGSHRGTISGAEGKFAIGGLLKGDMLSISYAGHNTHEIIYDGQKTVIVKLLKGDESPYALAVVTCEYANSPEAARLAYVAPDPGSAEEAPLYIVDGKPSEGGIKHIAPSDIANITVLRDGPEAVSLYGPKAANGVILISTKGVIAH